MCSAYVQGCSTGAPSCVRVIVSRRYGKSHSAPLLSIHRVLGSDDRHDHSHMYVQHLASLSQMAGSQQASSIFAASPKCLGPDSPSALVLAHLPQPISSTSGYILKIQCLGTMRYDSCLHGCVHVFLCMCAHTSNDVGAVRDYLAPVDFSLFNAVRTAHSSYAAFCLQVALPPALHKIIVTTLARDPRRRT